MMKTINWFFFEFTPQNPYLSSMIKFAILGTLGEWLGTFIRSKRSLGVYQIITKMIIWGLLGALIKWAFSSFILLIDAQLMHNLLPKVCGSSKILKSFCIALEINLFFAPFMMYFHRFLDNIATWTKSYAGMSKAIASIGWFWIPAHTITFSLPGRYQIVFAAALGVVLGIIMGITKKSIPNPPKRFRHRS